MKRKKPVEIIYYDIGTEEYSDHSINYVRNFFQDY